MAGNSGGPWGGGGNSGGNGGGRDPQDPNRGGRRPNEEGPSVPEIDELVKKGQEQLRVLMGGGGGGGGRRNGSGGGVGGPQLTRGTIGLAVLGAIALWMFASFYTVRPEEKSVELFLGKFSSVGEPGLNFAPWPVVTKEVIAVTREQTEEIGVGGRGGDAGLMLTRDENIVDIDFQVVWNITCLLYTSPSPRD